MLGTLPRALVTTTCSLHGVSPNTYCTIRQPHKFRTTCPLARHVETSCISTTTRDMRPHALQLWFDKLDLPIGRQGKSRACLCLRRFSFLAVVSLQSISNTHTIVWCLSADFRYNDYQKPRLPLFAPTKVVHFCHHQTFTKSIVSGVSIRGVLSAGCCPARVSHIRHLQLGKSITVRTSLATMG